MPSTVGMRSSCQFLLSSSACDSVSANGLGLLRPEGVPSTELAEAAPSTPQPNRTESPPADKPTDKPPPAPASEPTGELPTPATPGKSPSAEKKKPWWFTDRSDPIAHRTRASSRREPSTRPSSCRTLDQSRLNIAGGGILAAAPDCVRMIERAHGRLCTARRSRCTCRRCTSRSDLGTAAVAIHRAMLEVCSCRRLCHSFVPVYSAKM